MHWTCIYRPRYFTVPYWSMFVTLFDFIFLLEPNRDGGETAWLLLLFNPLWVRGEFIPEGAGEGWGESVLVLVDDDEAVHLLHLVTQHVHQLLHELRVPLVLHRLSIQRDSAKRFRISSLTASIHAVRRAVMESRNNPPPLVGKKLCSWNHFTVLWVYTKHILCANNAHKEWPGVPSDS